MTERHPWTRYVALGDSFTEGIGDPEPRSVGGHRGWADRVAEVLSAQTDDFAYANLAIRGRLLQQILDEQIEPALELSPTLSRSPREATTSSVRERTRTTSPHGSRPASPGCVATARQSSCSTDRTSAARRCSGASVARSRSTTRTCGRSRQRHDAIMADMWSLRELSDPRMWDADRLHFSPTGHHTIARMVLDALNVENDLEPFAPEPMPPVAWRQARRDDIVWAREYFGPWVLRRLRRQSSGDGIEPKRPLPGASS